MINYATLTPALWSIAREECVEVGNIAWPMLEECIRKGEAVYRGADGPEGFCPDYAEMKKKVEAEGCGDERRFFIQAFHAKYPELCELNADGKFMDMIVLVGGEMVKLAFSESPEAHERYLRLKKELDELAKRWHEEQ